jgi:hypothetical protein
MGEGQERARFVFREWVAPGAAVAAAIIAAGAGYFGAKQGVEASVQIARDDRRAAVDQRTQEKRATVYQDYLQKANDFNFEAADLASALAIKSGNLKKFLMTTEGTNAVTQYNNARAAYQGAINDVYVYGSDAAWAAHRKVAATLPPSLGAIDLTLPTGVPDQKEFNASYQAFQSVVCREVVAIPRQGCGKD